MIIAIASTRAPKVNGVKRAFEKLRGKFLFTDGQLSFESIESESGVSATPTSIAELMKGARNRAEHTFQVLSVRVGLNEHIFSVGVEGGLHSVSGITFLQSWACVHDGVDFWFGSSGSILLPDALSHAVLDEGKDLGKVIDAFAEQRDVRSNQGTWGILTRDIITREDSFELAAINALAPLFNKKMYQKEFV
jgi:inosine/xanthosine triphosphatase